ncbi:MAG: protein kinase [Planctomycetota bacterium]
MSADSDPVVSLVARCVAAIEEGKPQAVDALCEDHPDLAAEVRHRLDQLRDAGLLDEARGTADTLHSFGPYRVVRRLGAGGMGSVWLAEQQHPVKRVVALKVMKAGADSDELLARFELERQTLARMSHPHIAQLYDAGTTPSGQPYFAMEFVDGTPITAWADDRTLDASGRIRLLLPVLEAVQHAHQRGVIHRDLKPGNVLVADDAGTAVPKVIDFGIAKMLDVAGHDDHDAGLTAIGSLLGTPEYMSPEQMRGGAALADTRTDVFALGVMLYELLTGALPVDGRRLRRAGHLEMLRILLEEQPPAPSARVTTVTPGDGDGAAGARRAAQARSTTPTALRRRLRGELDWIVLKAIDRDSDRRYATVKELADDLRRHLAGDTVSAGPPSTWYRLRKTIARHRAVSVAAAVSLLCLVGGLIGVSVYARRAQRAGDQAIHRLQQVMDVVDSLLVEVGDKQLADVPQMEAARRDILRHAVEVLGKLTQEDDASAVPRVRHELGRAHMRLGRMHVLLGDDSAAHREFGQAIASFDDVIGQLSDPRLARILRARAAVSRAEVATTPQQAIAATERALAELRAADASSETLRQERARGLVEGLRALSGHHGYNDPAAAAAALREAIPLAAGLLPEPFDAKHDSQAFILLMCRCELGTLLGALGDEDGAVAALEQAVADADRFGEAAPDSTMLRYAAADARTRSAAWLRTRNEPERTLQLAQEAVDRFRALHDDHPRVLAFERQLALAARRLGDLQGEAGRFQDARDNLRLTIDFYERAVQTDAGAHSKTANDNLSCLANALDCAAVVELSMPPESADLDRAERDLTRGLEVATESVARQPANAVEMSTLLSLRTHLAGTCTMLGRQDDALRHYQAFEPLAARAVQSFPNDESVQIDAFLGMTNLAHMRLHLDDDAGSQQAFDTGTGWLEAYAERHPERRAAPDALAAYTVARAQALVKAARFGRGLDHVADVERLARAGSPRPLLEGAQVLAAALPRLRDESVAVDRPRPDLVVAYVAKGAELFERAVGLGLSQPSRWLEREPFATLRADPGWQAMEQRLANGSR